MVQGVDRPVLMVDSGRWLRPIVRRPAIRSSAHPAQWRTARNSPAGYLRANEHQFRARTPEHRLASGIRGEWPTFRFLYRHERQHRNRTLDGLGGRSEQCRSRLRRYWPSNRRQTTMAGSSHSAQTASSMLGSAMVAVRVIQAGMASGSTPCSAKCSELISITPATISRTESPQITRSSRPRAPATKSGPSDSATRGDSHSTGKRATC